MIRDKFVQCLAETLKKSDIALITTDTSEFVFRKVVTSSGFYSLLLICDLKLPDKTEFYGEGFQMLSQLGGTFSSPANIGRCPDDEKPYSHDHVDEYRLAHNMLLVSHLGKWVLMGFTSCLQNTGFFRIFKDGTLHICVSLEGKTYNSGDIITTDSFAVLEGSSKQEVLDEFAKLINRHHPMLPLKTCPSGWCSWYSFYENISEQLITQNVQAAQICQDLNFILIDDGYQSHMGDWLYFNDAFRNNLKYTIDAVRVAGKEPAIWIAPFIVSDKSRIREEHPDWLATDYDGNLIPSSYLTYGGWREQPWYVLDFSVDEVVSHIQNIFTYFRNELGIRFFKLDACYWGAVKGYLFRKRLSRIENYRLAMSTILKAVGSDSILLAVNAPLWPSLGLVHAMRISDDYKASHSRIISKFRENACRLWMNKRLWLNDPDVLTLSRGLSESDFNLHIASVLIGGSLLFSSDPLTALTDLQAKQFSYILKYLDKITTFSYDDSFEHFYTVLKGKRERIDVYVNWTSRPQKIILPPHAREFMTEKELTSKYDLTGENALITISPN